MPNIEPPENANVNITLALLPDARCHAMAVIEAQFEIGPLPITIGDLSLHVSSPSPGKLNLDVSGGATFTVAGLYELPEEARIMLTTMNADMINSNITQFGIEGEYLSEALSKIPGVEPVKLPREAADIKIENIRCTKFLWLWPTIEAAPYSSGIFRTTLTSTLSGCAFENRVDLSIDINITVEDDIMKIIMTFDEYFDLPRIGDNVLWNFQPPKIENIPGSENLSLENLGKLLKKYAIDLTLKAPFGANVSGLPPGYSIQDSTYTWSGDNAADALFLVLTEGAQVKVTYGHTPPAEFPWLVVGALVAVIVVTAVAVIVLRRR
jgi:hypothetical protein